MALQVIQGQLPSLVTYRSTLYWCGCRCKKGNKTANAFKRNFEETTTEFKMLVLLAVCVTIISANTFFVEAQKQQEVLEMKQASTSMAANREVSLICPDPNWACPDSQPCCFSADDWRCCPYIGGTRCAGGAGCCHSGRRCIWNLWCS